MTENLKLGVFNKLKIESKSDYGLYLSDAKKNRVLLPNFYVQNSMSIGDLIDVFIYKDSEDRIVATTQKPYAMRGEFAYLQVTDITPFGAFVDWGLPKELLVPKKMQKNPLKISGKYIFYITYDALTDRLVADTRIGRYLKNDLSLMRNLKTVDILIIAKTPLGYKVIADNLFEGMIYHNEIYRDIKIGEKTKGFIKKIRKDAKADISLNPVKKEKEDFAKEQILSLLSQNDFSLPFTYKSDSNEIRRFFAISKKAYKKALTDLLNENKIRLTENSITLLNPDDK